MKRYVKSSEDYSEMSWNQLGKEAKKKHLISSNADTLDYDEDLLRYALMYDIKLNKIRMREGKRLLTPDELDSLFSGNVREFKRLFAEFYPKEAKKNPSVYVEMYDKMDDPEESGNGYEVDLLEGEYQDTGGGYVIYFDLLGRYRLTEEAWEV